MSAARYSNGLWAERAAAALLWLKNYRIIERRARTPLGEVDIVAKRGNTLVLVEVKYRRSMNDALQCISSHQQQRLMRAANYLATRHTAETIRWDVVCIAPWAWPRHIVNAWDGV